MIVIVIGFTHLHGDDTPLLPPLPKKKAEEDGGKKEEIPLSQIHFHR